jgi:hypothetical protein
VVPESNFKKSKKPCPQTSWVSAMLQSCMVYSLCACD